MTTHWARARLAITLSALCIWTFGCASAPGSTPSTEHEPIDIPYSKFVLDNGLTLIVHEDHKAPIVAVNVWYHVGSKNEKPGKTGFAHLFEHLMFNGSENYDDDYFGPLQRVGATDMNGTTDADRTNYFQNVPVSALDRVLWLESDRMGHLLGAIDQAKLDEQRGVVKNEKRQREDQPYGQTYNLLIENSYPPGHPYSWTTIGSMEDLDAATMEDVQEWFETYYGAANAVVSIAGDVDTQEVKAKVEKYFGHIPAGPPIARHESLIAKRSGAHRQVTQDRVPQARVIKAWNIPGHDFDESLYLDLAGGVLGSGKTSRLYKRLVYEERIATDVSAYAWPREIGGLFMIRATALPGGDLAELEVAIDEELARFIAEGPSERELERIKMDTYSSFVRGVERIGGFGGKSDILASSEVFGGSPDAYQHEMRVIASAKPEQVRAAAESWLSDGVYVLEIHPYPTYGVAESDVDRSEMPGGGEPPKVSFPELHRAQLSSGLQIVFAERHAVPVVDFALLFDAGFASDQFASPGTANLAMNMLDEGTTSRSALEISEALSLLGARLGTGSNLDMSSVSLSTLAASLDPSLEIFADVVLRPAFHENELKRLKQQQIAAIQREKVTPRSMALRVFPQILYGPGHAYGIPFTGSGTEASVEQLTTGDLRAFHSTWFKPDNATLVVVGDTTLDEIIPKLEAHFGTWAPGDVPQKNLSIVEPQAKSSVYLLDRPGAQQSIIAAGHVAPPKANPNEAAIEIMNEVLGGSFSSRINMNLREEKHWAYGAHSFFVDTRGQRPFMVLAPVQTDRTGAAMSEIERELREILGDRPPQPDEIARAKDQTTLTLPGRWETAASVGSGIVSIVRFGFPDDHWLLFPEELRRLTQPEVTSAARDVLHPDRMIWVVVGDRKRIESEVRALKLGEITFLDANGQPMEEPHRAGREADASP